MFDETSGKGEGEVLEVGTTDQASINEFLDDIPITEEEGVVPVAETGEEKAPAEEPPAKKEEVGTTKEEEEEVTSTPTKVVVPTVKEVVPPDEITTLKAQIESLQALVDKLAAPTPKVEEPPVPTKSKDLAEILQDVDFDSVMESKENFSKFFLTAMEAVQEQTAQKILSSIPNIVGSHVQRQSTLRDVATEFYTRYPELKRVKRYVGTVANEIYAANPEMTLGQVMEEAARVAKETLNIQAEVVGREKRDATKPALPGSGGGARVSVKPISKLQGEIDDILND